MTAVDAPGLSYSSASGRWVLAVSVLGSGIAALDATVVKIALPTIGRDFRTGPDTHAAGFRTAVTITSPAREHRDAAVSEQCLHCGLDAPPLAASSDRRILAIQPRG
jgi:hypothetical protein